MPEANKAVIERKKGYLYVEYSKLYNMDDLVNLSKEALDISKSEGIKKAIFKCLANARKGQADGPL